MKVIFNDGQEAAVNRVSSPYVLVLDSVDETAVNTFKELLTNENLKSFKIVDDEGNLSSEGTDMRLSMVSSPDAFDAPANQTNFFLVKLTPEELRIAELESENEILSEALVELAAMVAE